MGTNPPSAFMAMSGAELILNLSASNDTIGKREYREKLVKEKSTSLMCTYLYASAGANESTTDLIFSGHCMICEGGKMLAENSRIAEITICLSQILTSNGFRQTA